MARPPQAGLQRVFGDAQLLGGFTGRVALHFAKNEFREAERAYKRVLDDPECPPERRAKAWFNRGTSLLRRGGDE